MRMTTRAKVFAFRGSRKISDRSADRARNALDDTMLMLHVIVWVLVALKKLYLAHAFVLGSLEPDLLLQSTTQ